MLVDPDVHPCTARSTLYIFTRYATQNMVHSATVMWIDTEQGWLDERVVWVHHLNGLARLFTPVGVVWYQLKKQPGFNFDHDNRLFVNFLVISPCTFSVAILGVAFISNILNFYRSWWAVQHGCLQMALFLSERQLINISVWDWIKSVQWSCALEDRT